MLTQAVTQNSITVPKNTIVRLLGSPSQAEVNDYTDPPNQENGQLKFQVKDGAATYVFSVPVDQAVSYFSDVAWDTPVTDIGAH